MIFFIRAKDQKDKSEFSLNVIAECKNNIISSNAYVVSPSDFKQVPGAPFSYWVTNNIRDIFTKYSSVESDDINVRVGIQSSDDYRFVRTSWEVDEKKAGSFWFPYAKGGSFSPLYSDLHLVINWYEDGREMKAWTESLYGGGQHWSRNLRSVSYSLRPGLTWTQRTNRLGIRVMPEGCMFGIKGPAIFSRDDSLQTLLALLALSQSKPFHLLVEMQMASASFDVGVIQRTPLPNLSSDDKKTLALLAIDAWKILWKKDTVVETSHAFCAPEIIQNKHYNFDEKLINESIESIRQKINKISFKLYEIVEEDIISSSIDCLVDGLENKNGCKKLENSVNQQEGDIDSLLSWAVGVAFGRFSMRFCSVSIEEYDTPEPFDSLPVRSPGRISEGELKFHDNKGILVDDPDNINDLVEIIISILEKVDIQPPVDIRHWLRRNFFNYHLKIYSQSRRQAPIYWPLQTSDGQYTLWIYFHELNQQTLFTCVNDFIDPKISSIRKRIQDIKVTAERSRNEEKELEKLGGLEAELLDMHDELLRVAQFWVPNLDDGVQLNAEAIASLFGHTSWKRKLNKVSLELEQGKYDWSKQAYKRWPERVLNKCYQDRSIAIAHNVDNELWEEVEVAVGRTKRTKWVWQPKKLSDAELKAYIQKKTEN